MAIFISGALVFAKQQFINNYSIMLSQPDIVVTLILGHQVITLSDHRLLCHAVLCFPIAHLRIGDPREICIDAKVFP